MNGSSSEELRVNVRRRGRVDCEGNPIKLPKRKRRLVRENGNLWEAPADMPDWMVELVKAGKMCGAKKVNKANRRMHPYCRNKITFPAKYGPPCRCQLHSGKAAIVNERKLMRDAADPDRTKQRAYKHGLYAKGMSPNEQQMVDEGMVPIDSVNQEIEIIKVRMARAIGFEREQLDLCAGDLPTEKWPRHQVMRKKRDKSGINAHGPTDEITYEYFAADWASQINLLVNQLARVYHTKSVLEGDSGQGDAERFAQARETLRALREGVKA